MRPATWRSAAAVIWMRSGGGGDARLQGRPARRCARRRRLQQRSSRKTSPNVIGVLAGANEQQAVVFTSHYDHFGIRDAAAGRSPRTPTASSTAPTTTRRASRACSRSRRQWRGRRRNRADRLCSCSRPPRSRVCWVPSTSRQHPPLPMDAGRRQPQRRRHELSRADRDLVLLGADRSTLGPMAEAFGQGAESHPRSGPASGARLLLPLRSLPARQGRRAGTVDQRAARVHRPRRRGAEEEARGVQRDRLPSAVATSTTRRGTLPAPSRT